MVTKERIEELRTKAKEELAYKKAHRNELLIKRLEEMVPFDDECIPSPPIVDNETYRKYVIPNFVRCGAIPSSELIVGKKYYGHYLYQLGYKSVVECCELDISDLEPIKRFTTSDKEFILDFIKGLSFVVECPNCGESIEYGVEICPKCNCKLEY